MSANLRSVLISNVSPLYINQGISSTKLDLSDPKKVRSQCQKIGGVIAAISVFGTLCLEAAQRSLSFSLNPATTILLGSTTFLMAGASYYLYRLQSKNSISSDLNLSVEVSQFGHTSSKKFHEIREIFEKNGFSVKAVTHLTKVDIQQFSPYNIPLEFLKIKILELKNIHSLELPGEPIQCVPEYTEYSPSFALTSVGMRIKDINEIVALLIEEEKNLNRAFQIKQRIGDKNLVALASNLKKAYELFAFFAKDSSAQTSTLEPIDHVKVKTRKQTGKEEVDQGPPQQVEYTLASLRFYDGLEKKFESWRAKLTGTLEESIAKKLEKYRQLGPSGKRVHHAKPIDGNLYEIKFSNYGFRIYYTIDPRDESLIILGHTEKKDEQGNDILKAKDRLKKIKMINQHIT